MSRGSLERQVVSQGESRLLHVPLLAVSRPQPGLTSSQLIKWILLVPRGQQRAIAFIIQVTTTLQDQK